MGDQENVEANAELQGTKKEDFSEDEQLRIKDLASELYNSSGEYIGDSEGEAIQQARNELTLIGCDTSRAHDLGPGISPEEYAMTVIGRGKGKAVGEYESLEGDVEKVDQEEALVITKDLTDKTPTEIKTEKSTIKIVQKDGAENNLIAEIYNENGVQVGTFELGMGGNSVGRPAENEIIINLREVSDTQAVIEFSQSGTSLKGLNPSEN